MATCRSEAPRVGEVQPGGATRSSSIAKPRPLDEVPSDEEAAVLIAAAVAALVGTPGVQGTLPPVSTGTAWRFSGRWWAHPIVRRRERPWPSA